LLDLPQARVAQGLMPFLGLEHGAQQSSACHRLGEEVGDFPPGGLRVSAEDHRFSDDDDLNVFREAGFAKLGEIVATRDGEGIDHHDADIRLSAQLHGRACGTGDAVGDHDLHLGLGQGTSHEFGRRGIGVDDQDEGLARRIRFSWAFCQE
jgi:hypothetical protein